MIPSLIAAHQYTLATGLLLIVAIIVIWEYLRKKVYSEVSK